MGHKCAINAFQIHPKTKDLRSSSYNLAATFENIWKQHLVAQLIFCHQCCFVQGTYARTADNKPAATWQAKYDKRWQKHLPCGNHGSLCSHYFPLKPPFIGDSMVFFPSFQPPSRGWYSRPIQEAISPASVQREIFSSGRCTVLLPPLHRNSIRIVAQNPMASRKMVASLPSIISICIYCVYIYTYIHIYK